MLPISTIDLTNCTMDQMQTIIVAKCNNAPNAAKQELTKRKTSGTKCNHVTIATIV